MPSTIGTVLASVDLEEGSAEVVRVAGALSGAVGAALHVVHVGGSLRGAEADVLARSTDTSETEETALRLRREVDAALGAGAPEVRLVVRSGTAQDEIIGYAREVGADVVVVGPHRGGGVSAHMLGSTAERLVKAARRPVLVARGSLATPVQQIGVATDFSAASDQAVEVARGWALSLGADVLRVLHVGQSLNRDTAYEQEVVQPGMERIRGDAGGLRVETEFVWSHDEAEGVVDWTAANRLPLLVMGTHGREGFKRAVLGSTAVKVARKAPCPVLLIPGAADEE